MYKGVDRAKLHRVVLYTHYGVRVGIAIRIEGQELTPHFDVMSADLLQIKAQPHRVPIKKVER